MSVLAPTSDCLLTAPHQLHLWPQDLKLQVFLELLILVGLKMLLVFMGLELVLHVVLVGLEQLVVLVVLSAPGG